MNCGINDISFDSFKPNMANAQLQALQYVQNKFGRESFVLGDHRLKITFNVVIFIV
jgi:hypothetical protein